jgi:hypothetical protein
MLVRRHHCRYCGQLFCGYCAKERWSLPKFEYIDPVRVCGKCSKVCWKAEALVQAVNNNDVSAVSKYVSMQNDCMLHTGVHTPLTLASSAGCSEICRILLSGGAKVNHAVAAPQRVALVTCHTCNFTDAVAPRTGSFKCARCGELNANLGYTANGRSAPSDVVGTTGVHDRSPHTFASSRE